MPEFTADVGTKKGEKVDYAILVDEKPIILIECKRYGELADKHADQLFRYYGTTTAKFGILTDGITYKFYTDLNEQNKMDLEPFMIFNVLDIHEHTAAELKRFTKKSLDVDTAYLAAVELKYTNRIKEFLHGLRAEPSDSFVKYIMSEIYDGKQMKKAVENFKPIVKRGLNQYISDTIRETLKNAMKSQSDEEAEQKESKVETTEEQPDGGIISLTQEELEAFSIIKSILRDICDVDRLSCQNSVNYVSVVLDDSKYKRVCRIWFKRKQKYVSTPDENKKPIKQNISSLNDIYKYSDLIRESYKRYLSKDFVQDEEDTEL